MQIKLNTRNSKKPQWNIERVSGRYQLKRKYKKTPSHIFLLPWLLPNPYIFCFEDCLVGFWKTQLNWEGVWKCWGTWLVRNVLLRINIELTCEERPKQVVCLDVINTFCCLSYFPFSQLLFLWHCVKCTENSFWTPAVVWFGEIKYSRVQQSPAMGRWTAKDNNQCSHLTFNWHVTTSILMLHLFL